MHIYSLHEKLSAWNENLSIPSIFLPSVAACTAAEVNETFAKDDGVVNADAVNCGNAAET